MNLILNYDFVRWKLLVTCNECTKYLHSMELHTSANLNRMNELRITIYSSLTGHKKLC